VEVEEIGGKKVSEQADEAGASRDSSGRGSAVAGTGCAGDGQAIEMDAGYQVKAPLRGTIVSVQCSPADVVEKGETLMVLEAMKLENEISAPVPGRVTGVLVEQGASVEAGDVLLVIDASSGEGET